MNTTNRNPVHTDDGDVARTSASASDLPSACTTPIDNVEATSSASNMMNMQNNGTILILRNRRDPFKCENESKSGVSESHNISLLPTHQALELREEFDSYVLDAEIAEEQL